MTYRHRRKRPLRHGPVVDLVAVGFGLASLAILAFLLLTACGGGGDPDTDRDIGPPDCRARPELCQ
ncbi:MAG: hypothetical protein RJA36_39 [Pseudomonadota bacterium]